MPAPGAAGIAVSVLVVSYNTRDLTLACLASVYEQTQRHVFEVIVVDNASTDGSADAIAAAFPQVRLIANEENLGFAGANNLAAADAVGEYLLLLNPDTVVLDEAIDRIVDFACRQPAPGIFGGRTVFADGCLNPSSVWRRPTVWNTLCRASGISGVFPRSGLLSGDAYGGWDRDSDREVDIVSGCFLLISRSLWDELGGFDTGYFMYGEDWDLCFRARWTGARCWFCADAEIVHYGGASEAVRADKLVRLLETKVRLFRDHYSRSSARLMCWGLVLWAIRSLVTARLRGRLDDARAWSSVLARRAIWMGGGV